MTIEEKINLLTNKKEYSSPWETGDAEEETSGIW